MKIDDLNIFTNKLIQKISLNLEKFNYNVIVANIYETYNFLIKHLENNNNSKNFFNFYKKILIIFSPVLPHLTSECLEELKINENIQWPNVDKKYLNNIGNLALRYCTAVVANQKKECWC